MITLRRILHRDLEALRCHRNEASTRCYLGDSSEISSQQQVDWWHRHCANEPSDWTDPRLLVVPVRTMYRIAQIEVKGVGVEDIGLVRASTGGCVGADVFSKWRGRGLGHEVFAAACTLPPPDAKLWLQVFLENLAAMKIYRRAGFALDENAVVEVRCREFPNYARPRLLHYVTMRKPS